MKRQARIGDGELGALLISPQDRDSTLLPSGRHGLSPQFVLAHQRERLLRAVCRACSERGYASVTVADIVRQARVSRRAFYAHYSSKEDCFLDAFTTLLARFRRRVGAVVLAAGFDWRERVAVGLAELLKALEEQPDAARTLFVDALSGGPRVIRQRQRALRECAAELNLPAGAPKELAESVVGAVAEVILTTVLEGRASQLASLHGELLYCTLVPLVGHAEAEAALERASALTNSSSCPTVQHSNAVQNRS